MLRCRLREQARLEPATGPTMIMDHEGSVRISNLEICEMTAVWGCKRRRSGSSCVQTSPLGYPISSREAFRSPRSARQTEDTSWRISTDLCRKSRAFLS